MTGQIINGIIVGTGYALVAMGWTLVFGVLGKLNMAHGEMFMASAIVAWLTWGVVGARDSVSIGVLAIAGVFGVVAGAASGLVVYVAGFRTLRGRGGELAPIVTTLAIGAIAVGLGVVYFGAEPRVLTTARIGGNVSVLGNPVAVVQIVIAAAALATAVLVLRLVQHTAWGRGVRAISESQAVAERAGIRVNRVVAQVFMLSGAIAGVGSFLWMLRVGSVSPFIGHLFLIKGLIVMVIGGLGRIDGALGAGLLIGVLEGVAIAQFSGAYAELVTWGGLIALLLLRPEGLIRAAA